MKKKKTNSPDHRLDWRDPNMPLFAQTIHGTTRIVTPDQMQRVSQYRMGQTVIPDWQNDPTYNLRKK